MPDMHGAVAAHRRGDDPVTIADLEAMADKLKEAKRECAGQLRAIEADLCAVELALSEVRSAMVSARKH